MALRFLSRTPPRHLAPGDSPTADSLPDTSQIESSNGARDDGVDRTNTKTKEAEYILANLEKAGVEIDGKIASIVDEEVARIKAEAMRENISKPKRIGAMVLKTAAFTAVGFVMGVKCYEIFFRMVLEVVFKGLLFALIS